MGVGVQGDGDGGLPQPLRTTLGWMPAVSISVAAVSRRSWKRRAFDASFGGQLARFSSDPIVR